jgi:hypothetical protein
MPRTRVGTRADGKQLCCRPGTEVNLALAGENLGPYKGFLAYPKTALAEPRPVPQKSSQQPWWAPKDSSGNAAPMPGLSLARGSAWAGGRDHTPSQVPQRWGTTSSQRWGTTSCREAAPLTPHAQPGTPAVGYHQLSRGSSTYTTRPAGYPSGGVPPAVERHFPTYLLTHCRAPPQRWWSSRGAPRRSSGRRYVDNPTSCQ